jgi:hypothetical protein
MLLEPLGDALERVGRIPAIVVRPADDVRCATPEAHVAGPADARFRSKVEHADAIAPRVDDGSEPVV